MRTSTQMFRDSSVQRAGTGTLGEDRDPTGPPNTAGQLSVTDPSSSTPPASNRR